MNLLSFRARTTITYVALAAAWIFLSDRVLAMLVADTQVLSLWQTGKGMLFVALTTWLVYWLSGRAEEPKTELADTPDGSSSGTTAHARLITTAVALVSLTLCAAALVQIERYRVQQLRAIALDRATDHGRTLQGQLRQAMSATYALAAIVRQGDGRVDQFEALAREMLPLYRGVSALALAPDGVVRQIAPYAGNESAVGIDILNDPKRRPTALAAMRSRQVTIAGPLRLSNGGIGLIGRLAVFVERDGKERFWGFVTAVTPLSELVRAGDLGQMAAAGYDYELRSADAVLARSAFGPPRDPVVSEVSLPTGTWTLSISPVDGWHSGPALLVESLLALLASGLITYLTHLLLRQPTLLRVQVNRRTRELAAANRRLTLLNQAVEQSPATVVITDRNGLIEYVNPKFTAVTGYKPAEVIGENPRLIQSGQTSDAVYADLWQTLTAGREWRGELCNRRKDGSLFWEFEVIAPVRDEQGAIDHFIAVKEDVTDRHDAAAGLERLNRTLRVISQVNGALVRAADEPTLLRNVGEILCRSGGYGLVWVGMADAEHEMQLRPAMIHPDGLVTAPQLTCEWTEFVGWPGFIGVAMAERRAVLCERVVDDPYYEALADRLAPRACVAGLALPLIFDDQRFGVLVLHAADTERFGRAELALLQELADDVAYGIAARRGEEARRLAMQAIAASSNGIMISSATLADRPFTYVNPAFERITGYSAGEALGRNGRFLLAHDLDQPAVEEIRLALRERRDARVVLRSYRKDGSMFWNELAVSPVRNADGQTTHFVSVITDISERKRYEEQLEFQSNHDQLTGLPNRNLLADRLDQAIRQATRGSEEVAVVVIDLDHFKVVNDSLGHAPGDELLQTVARRLESCLREGDTLARAGGDEFLLVLPAPDATKAAQFVVARLQAEMASPLDIAGKRLTVTASIGISLYPRDDADGPALIRDAEAAMYRVKEQGRNGFQFFTAAINARVRERQSLEEQLRRALEREEFVLHYQPQVDLASGTIVGSEALVRWQHPELGMVPPARFIPIAEETGLIVALGEWVLWTACRQNQAWLAADLPAGRIGVNLSARQFIGADLPALTRRVLDETRLDATLLDLEVTESMAMQDVDQAIRVLQDIRALGVRTSLDDFGTGHSSLSYLKRFALNTLKIDRSFVHGITSDPHNATIATTIIAMAHSLGLNVIAEGVELAGELHYLRKHRCDEVQGYYFSKPLPADELATLLRDRHRLFDPASGETDTTRTVLLVDDEPNVLAALKRLLRRDNYRVLAAGSAAEGFELLAANPVQVIISDQRMPEMSGTEFLARVKQIYPNTLRMVLSGYADLNSVTDAINQGAIYKFLSKPWDDEALRETVRMAFRVQEQADRR